jgi:hypothetical protein
MSCPAPVVEVDVDVDVEVDGVGDGDESVSGTSWSTWRRDGASSSIALR